MILPFLLALIAFAALLPILAPLLQSRRPDLTRASFDQAVYRDQLRELDRDIARGLITSFEADAARLEIQRRLLVADNQPAAPSRLSRSPVLAATVFVVVTAGSVCSYLWLGAPGVPDEPFSGRQAEIAQQRGKSSLQQAADTLAAKLKRDPSDASGWLLYGRTMGMLSQWGGAEDALRHAIELGQTSPEVVGEHAEMMVMQASGTVTPAAQVAFQQLLKTDPSSGLARYYMAIAAMQAGEPRKAIDGFQGLLADLPEASPLRAQLAQRVAEAARAAGVPMPELAKGTQASTTPQTLAETQTSAQIRGSPQVPEPQVPPSAPVQSSQGGAPDEKAVADAAKMTGEQQQAMIRGMVASLAAKQAADPSNLEGWLRLGRAYAVLHEPDHAAEAFDKAAGLKPDDISIPLQEARALLSDHAPADKLPPPVIRLLKQVEANDPQQPLVLWYLGMAAAQDSQPDVARRYWSTLLTKLPAGSEDAQMIQSALDTLTRGSTASGG